ncbi:MAG: hypothetical protein IT261_03555 [Saprospiraceae bacterium]|nr:hypothetical protein [Saprospiraceae bacterium]
MHKLTLLLLSFLLFSTFLSAQSDTLPPKIFLRNMELGIDAVPYIAGEVGASVLFKKRFRGPYFRGKSHRQTSLRSHFKFTGYNSGFRQYLGITAADTLSYRRFNGQYQHLGLSLGIEQQFVRKRLGTYIGAEAFGFYKWSNGEYQVDAYPFGQNTPFITETYDGGFAERAFGVAALFGIRYFIFSQLSLGLEVHFSAALSFTEVENQRDGFILYDNNHTLDYRLQPIRVLYLSYHFGQ